MLPNRKINDIISNLYTICSDRELMVIINDHLGKEMITISGVRKRRLRMGLKKEEKIQYTHEQYSEAVLLLQAAMYEAFLNMKINWFFDAQHFSRFLSSRVGKQLLTEITIRLAKEVLHARINTDESCESSTKDYQGKRCLRDAVVQ